MFNCKDPKLTYLNSLGYNVVRLPREGIDPLDVLGRENGSIDNLGPLDLVWTTTGAPPKIAGPQVVPNVNGEKSEQLDFSVGIKILEGILKGMGATLPMLSGAFKQAKKIQLQFVNVQGFSVRPLEIGNYLQKGDLNLDNNVAAHFFTEEDAQAFIITEVLKSNAIEVIATDSHGQSISADLPKISKMVGGNVKVEATGQGTLKFVHQGGKDPLTFGFKVFAIWFENGRWVIRGVKPDAGLPLGQPGEEEEQGRPILFKENGLLGEIGKAKQ
jgi:hypothetical protein